jgi:hypothetical protein
MPRKNNNRKRNSKGRATPSDAWIRDSDPGGVRGFVQTSPLDMVIKPPSMTMTYQPPVGFERRPYWFKKQSSTTFAVSTGGLAAGALSFQLSDVTDFVTLAALFDQYCIYCVVVRFDPEITTGTIGGVFASVIDFDNATVPASLAQLQGYSTYTSMNVLQGACQERVVKVCSTPLVYNGVATSAFLVGQNWVDCANTGVPHYGIRFGVSNNTSAYTIAIQATYYVAFRNTI